MATFSYFRNLWVLNLPPETRLFVKCDIIYYNAGGEHINLFNNLTVS